MRLLEESLQPHVRWLIALDDWCPNYGPVRAMVKAAVVRLWAPSGDAFRVLLSWADDFALVMDDMSLERAKYVLEQLPPIISQQAARDRGFVDW